MSCDKCGEKCESSSNLQDHKRRYLFERTPCGNSLCNDANGMGLGCVCHLCDILDDDDLSDVSLNEEHLSELQRLAEVNDVED